MDTLSIVRRLEAAKIDRQHAEAIAEVLHESEAGALADLATKSDLQMFEQRLDARIDGLRGEMELRFGKVDARFEKVNDRFDTLEQRMTVKLGSMLVFAIGIVAVLVRLL